jgi:hypothetical protein
VAAEALANAKLGARDIAAIGITNQRETHCQNAPPAIPFATPSFGRIAGPQPRATE